MPIPHSTTIGMVSGALLLGLSAMPATAAGNSPAYSVLSIAQEIIGKTRRSGHNQALINQALKARDAGRPGDELDECMKENEGNDDYIGTLGGCFCLTTDAHNPACGQEYEPED